MTSLCHGTLASASALALQGVALALAWPWACSDGLGLACSGLGLGVCGLVNIPGCYHIPGMKDQILETKTKTKIFILFYSPVNFPVH